MEDVLLWDNFLISRSIKFRFEFPEAWHFGNRFPLAWLSEALSFPKENE